MENKSLEHLVFVIGAGAHVCYKMPTAEGLSRNITDLLIAGGNNWEERVQSYFPKGNYKHLENIKDIVNTELSSKKKSKVIGIEYIEKTIKGFGETGLYSIDKWIQNLSEEKKGDYELKCFVGKAIIAYLIKMHEDRVPIFHQERDWIEYIVNNTSVRNFSNENGPHFFTFNYDNLLEKRFFHHLRENHRMSNEKALDIVREMSIHHVYGDIKSVGVEQKFNQIDVYDGFSSNIKVMGEERDCDSKHLKKISNKFIDLAKKENSRIYFLGFGFDPLNIRNLFGSEYMDLENKPSLSAGFFSTNINMTRSKIYRIREALPPVKVNFYDRMYGDDVKPREAVYCQALIEDKVSII